jgi:hypothetical protein
MAKLTSFLGALTLLAATGCGPDRGYDGPERFPLSGQVTFDGRPVDGGSISFIPKDKDGRVSGGQLVQGRYDVPAEMGANAGAYQVQIRWPQPTGKKHWDEDTFQVVPEFKETMPPKFNSKSDLTADVTATKLEFNFDLKK